MKKAIVASVLGVAASAALGQGVINFNNYAALNYNSNQVLWGAGTGHTPGTPVTPTQNVQVQLFYQIGTVNESSAAFLSDPLTHAGISGGISAAFNPTGVYGVGPYGYYALGNQILTGWSSGPVTFLVAAWDTTTGGGTLAGAMAYGMFGLSAFFTATDAVGTGPGIVSSSLPAHNFATINGVAFVLVPEPTTMALGGLSLAALMLVRRKKV